MVKKITSDNVPLPLHPGTRENCPGSVGSVNGRRVAPRNLPAVSHDTNAQQNENINRKLSKSSITAVTPTPQNMVANNAEDKVISGLHRVAAHARQGIPLELLRDLQKAASERGAALLTRPVEPICRTLIAEGWPTKHFRIKAKSSNWGAQAGTIPVLQRYSKLALDTESKIDKYTRLARESLVEEECARAIPLTISTARLTELEQQGYLYGRNERATPEGTRCLYFTTRTCHQEDGPEHRQLLILQPNGQWAVHDADCSPSTPIMVMAQPVAKPGAQPLPMTADVDPLMEIFPREELDLEKRDRLPLPMISDRVVSRQVDRYRKRAQKYFQRGKISGQELKSRLEHYNVLEKKLLADFYATTDLFGKSIFKEDLALGNVSSRTREMVQHYQQALNREYPVIHHNVDAHSLATDEKANFPITAFFPTSLNMAEGICMIFNEQQLLQVLEKLMDRGYAIQKNPLWKNRLDHSHFVNARARIAQSLDALIIRENNKPPKDD